MASYCYLSPHSNRWRNAFGTLAQEVCQLRWEWEVPVAELQSSVFVIPAEFGGRSERPGVKNRADWVVVLNDVAKRVIDAQRGLHRQFVFVANKGKPRQPIRYMNNAAWQNARKKARSRICMILLGAYLLP